MNTENDQTDYWTRIGYTDVTRCELISLQIVIIILLIKLRIQTIIWICEVKMAPLFELAGLVGFEATA